MEQIYYTQCPVGYGLGASNGFQVKRLSPGYPASGDFRHLGLRAFPGGSRTLAPPTLRYRRDGEAAEVAALTPRAHEYETERGPWGRPGGHFAHGLRLGLDELAAIRQWPAGLHDGPLWRRADPEPTRGRPPDAVALGPAALIRSPDFAGVAPLAEGTDPETLARLLTALALAVREGQTLFLVDEPAKLGPRVALLTFAFPERFRPDLTFSTYHDRPEELPAYRIQGTIPAARPNKPALTALGVVADLTLGTFEPGAEPAPWSRALAGWLIRRDPVDEADWSATDERARAARLPPDGSAWSDAWLGLLFGFPEASRDRTPPTSPEGWRALRDFAEWAGRARLDEEWARPRGPSWWSAIDPGGLGPDARAALVAHVRLPAAWRGGDAPAAWGAIVAAWFREAGAEEGDPATSAAMRAAPPAARPAFAGALLRGLHPEGADAVLRRLRGESWCDPAILLPLEATAAVAAILAGEADGPLRAAVEEARGLDGAIPAVLEAVEAGLADRPDALPALAGAVAGAFGTDEGLSWALRRGKAAASWLAPALRPILADPGRKGEWVGLRDRTPEPLRPGLARAVLTVALDPGLPDEAFRWGVEALLLPLAPRPHDPAWAEAYLRRTPSGLDLLRRFNAPDFRKLGILGWLKQVRALGAISDEQWARVESCLEYARALASRDAGALQEVHVPAVPPEERGQILGQMLGHVGGAGLEGLPFVLGACRDSWPGAFEPGAAGLRSLAVPLARCLGTLGLPPAGWLDRLGEVVARLGLDGPGGRGYEPDGLAAEVVAAANDPGHPAWAVRQILLRDDRAWRALAADVRRDLGRVAPEAAPEVLGAWDGKLAQDRPERFFELFLNAADGPRRSACVLARAADLRSLPPLPWWDQALHPGARDDLRDGYALTAPMSPLPPGGLGQVRPWVEGRARGVEAGDALSDLGEARWRALVALTDFRNVGRDPSARWAILLSWKAALPLGSLPADDRYRVVAWIIEGLDEVDAHQVAELAGWLRNSRIKDPARLTRWAEEIEGLIEIDGSTKIARSKFVADLRGELYRQLRDEQAARKPPAAGPGVG